jgi:pseudouridine-5'-monophosphatase
MFQQWAQLPISHDEYVSRITHLQTELFKHTKPLPGVTQLLQNLSRSTAVSGRKMHMAVATSSHLNMFKVKTSSAEASALFTPEIFAPSHIVCGDDPRVPRGRGKPLPDIYLTALETINEAIAASGSDEPPVRPEECLVFEDAVPGCEAGRRAGCRVVWCPHEGLLGEYRGREKEVLAGATGEVKQADLERAGASKFEGSPGCVGEVDDGWAELVPSLENFDYEKYGIQVCPLRN